MGRWLITRVWDKYGKSSYMLCVLFIEIHTGLPCFRHLVAMLKRLSQKDVDKLTMKYLRNKRSEVAGQTMIDALGTAQTSDCYTVMMRRVLLAKRPEAELLMRALFQLFELSAPIPEVRSCHFYSRHTLDTLLQIISVISTI